MSDDLISALKEETKAKALLTKAIMVQTDVISQLVNSIALLIDTTEVPEPGDGGSSVPTYLMDGTRIN